MDNFSAWIIVASLIALRFDPTLWYQLHGGDEKLLFVKSDFNSPATSEVFNTLESSPYRHLAELGRQVRKLLSLPPDQIPPVAAELLTSINVFKAAEAAIDSSPVVSPTSHGGGYHDVGAPDASWVLDHLAPLSPSSFGGSLLVPRLVFVLWLALSVIVGWATATALLPDYAGVALSSGLAISLVTCFVIDYRRRHESRTRREQLQVARALRGQLRNVERGLNEVGRMRERAQGGEKNELQELAKQMGRTASNENDAITRVANETASAISRQQQEHTQSVQKEREALAASLRRLQDLHIDRALRAYSLQTASIAGIGDGLKRRLVSAGVRSAADVRDWRNVQVSTGYRRYTKEVAQLNVGGSWRRVDGIGPAKAADLVEWRNNCASAARRSAPSQLPQSDRRQIAQQFEAQRASVERQIALMQDQQRHKTAAIRQSADQQRHILDQQVVAVKARYATQYATLAAESQRWNRDVGTVRWRLAEAERTLSEYRRITGARYLLAILGRR